MKSSFSVSFVTLLFIGLAAASPIEILSEEQKLRNFIDSLLNRTIASKIASLPDPLSVEFKQLNVTVPGVSTGDAELSNLIVTGLQKIVASEISSDLLQSEINATINVPQLSVSTKYDADVVLVNLLPLYGNGKFGLDVEGVEVKLNAKYNLLPFKIYDLKIGFDLEKVLFNIRGFLNNDALSTLIGEVLNDNVVDFIKNHKALIDGILTRVVNSKVDPDTFLLPEVDEELAAFQKKYNSLN